MRERRGTLPVLFRQVPAGARRAPSGVETARQLRSSALQVKTTACARPSIRPALRRPYHAVPSPSSYLSRGSPVARGACGARRRAAPRRPRRVAPPSAPGVLPRRGFARFVRPRALPPDARRHPPPGARLHATASRRRAPRRRPRGARPVALGLAAKTAKPRARSLYRGAVPPRARRARRHPARPPPRRRAAPPPRSPPPPPPGTRSPSASRPRTARGSCSSPRTTRPSAALRPRRVRGEARARLLDAAHPKTRRAARS